MARQRGLVPAQLIAISFTAMILVGTAILMLPISYQSGKTVSFVDAFFTSTSAVAITGLATVDTATHWTIFGQIVICVLVEIGGLGIITLATLIALLLEGGRISIRGRMNASLEASATAPDVRTLLRNILGFMIFFQLILAMILGIRFYFKYDYSLGDAIGHSIFHSVSAFNNAGFSLYSDSLIKFADDAWIVTPIFMTIFVAGFGFPVLVELRKRLTNQIQKWRGRASKYVMPKQWSLNTRIVLIGTTVLSVAGAIYIAILEWNNPNTIGGMPIVEKLNNSLFTSVITRSAGFNTFDYSQMHESTWLGMDLLMFIGGGSASTAGGIRIATAAVLIYVVFTEMRGDDAVNIGNRRLPRSMQRQALSIVGLTVAVIGLATFTLRMITDFSLDQILFEVISAIATVGLSIGVTAELPEVGKILLALVMLFGRLGPIVVAASLAGRTTKKHFEYPKERPLIG